MVVLFLERIRERCPKSSLPWPDHNALRDSFRAFAETLHTRPIRTQVLELGNYRNQRASEGEHRTQSRPYDLGMKTINFFIDNYFEVVIELAPNRPHRTESFAKAQL